MVSKTSKRCNHEVKICRYCMESLASFCVVSKNTGLPNTLQHSTVKYTLLCMKGILRSTHSSSKTFPMCI
uniref:Uncharacterized protein n=1 Tax=Anguilla anguilla TaxID=7936 RepID=A0A0E9ST79_ANGAN